ncbi:MAG: RNB domain-containing ribonuclease [Collinsella aerofaciens]
MAQLGIIDDRRAAGIALGSPDELQAAVDAAAGTANAPLVNTLLLRSMQRALYKPRNEGHFALAAPCYCHFTSPIRRYPDLVVHRVLKLQLAYEQLGGKDALVRTPRLIGKGRESLPRILPQICRACSDAERAADAASHATQKIKIAQYYEDRLGERYAGTISWVSSMGLCALGSMQVELDFDQSLGNEWFEFDEDALTLTGADTGTRYELGQRVIIEVSRVNTTRGHLDFKLIH